MKQILSIENLGVNIGGEQILDNVSCSIPVNKITVIIGPSGAGKSSFLKAIVRLFRPEGTIKYLNKDTTQMDIQKLRREVVYVPQVPVIFPGTVQDNINWGRNIWNMEKIDGKEQLELVGLEVDLLHQNAEDLSVGQQQRLQLARSLAINPKALLLDEPASGLDAISKDVFEQLILKLQGSSSGLTIIMITHDLDQARRIGEYGILMDKGHIILEATAEEFFREAENMSQSDMLEKLLQEEDQ